MENFSFGLKKKLRMYYPFLITIIVWVQGLEVIVRQTGSINRVEFSALSLLIGLFFSLIVYWIVRTIDKDQSKRTLLFFIISLVIFYYHIIAKVYDRVLVFLSEYLRAINDTPPIVFKLLLVVGVVIIVMVIKQNKRNFESINTYFSVVVLVFLTIQVYPLVNRFITSQEIRLLNQPEINSPSINATDSIPDIYYIIVDAYTSNGSLMKYAGYNNDLDSLLKIRGFYIASSKSNYPVTYPSLASTLNMSYLNFENREWIGYEGQRILKDQSINNIVFSFLRDLDYNIVGLSHILNTEGIASISEKPDVLYYTSIYRRCAFYPLIQYTVEKRAISQEWGDENGILNPLNYSYHVYNESVFNFLWKGISRQENKPNFVFAHLMNTHAPFVSDLDGNYINDQFSYPTLSGYLTQIQNVNNKLILTIDLLLSDKKNKVIIIQSDHGSHLFGIDEMFDIQNNYYFSDHNYESLYPSISPVNTFRIILNKYYNQDLEILPDKQFQLNY